MFVCLPYHCSFPVWLLSVESGNVPEFDDPSEFYPEEQVDHPSEDPTDAGTCEADAGETMGLQWEYDEERSRYYVTFSDDP